VKCSWGRESLSACMPNTYVHNFSDSCTYKHKSKSAFHGSITVSKGQQDVEQVINTQVYTIFTVQNTINNLQNSIIDHPYT